MERISPPETASSQCATVLAYNWKLFLGGRQRCRKILRHMLREGWRKGRFSSKTKLGHRCVCFVVFYRVHFTLIVVFTCFYVFQNAAEPANHRPHTANCCTAKPLFSTSLHRCCSVTLGGYLDPTAQATPRSGELKRFRLALKH